MIPLLLAAALANPPAVTPMFPLDWPLPEVRALADGTPLWILPRRGAPLVRVALTLRQGYLDAPDPAAALLAGALAGQGADLAAIGGALDVGVGAQRTWAAIEFVRGGEDAALAALWAAVTAPDLGGRPLRRQRQAWGSPGVGSLHSASVDEAFLPDDHPMLFRPTRGSYRGIRAGRVEAAWARLRAEAAPALAVVGDVDPDAIAALLEASWPGLAGTAAPQPLPPPAPLGGVILVDVPGAAQAQISLVLPAPGAGDPALPAAVLAERILGGDFTSRLNTALREESGLVYGLYSSLEAWPGLGRLEIRCAVAPEAAAATIAGIAAEVAALVQSPPTAAEIEAAWRSLWREEALDQLRLSSLAGRLATAQAYGQPPDARQRRLAAQAALTPADVAAAAAAWQASPQTWVITGDAGLLAPALADGGWDPDRVWRRR